MEEISQLIPFYGGITYDRLGEKGLQWPCVSENDTGTRFLYEDGFPAGNARLRPVEDCISADEGNAEFPYMLVTIQSLCHSGSFSLHSQGLEELNKDRSAELNATDAEQLQIESGDPVTITSERGTITIPSKITERTPKGRVLVPYHINQLMVNLLTDKDNPLTPVKVKKA